MVKGLVALGVFVAIAPEEAIKLERAAAAAKAYLDMV
jgi:hypothetical protein